MKKRVSLSFSVRLYLKTRHLDRLLSRFLTELVQIVIVFYIIIIVICSVMYTAIAFSNSHIFFPGKHRTTAFESSQKVACFLRYASIIDSNLL